MFRKAGT